MAVDVRPESVVVNNIDTGATFTLTFEPENAPATYGQVRDMLLASHPDAPAGTYILRFATTIITAGAGSFVVEYDYVAPTPYVEIVDTNLVSITIQDPIPGAVYDARFSPNGETDWTEVLNISTIDHQLGIDTTQNWYFQGRVNGGEWSEAVHVQISEPPEPMVGPEIYLNDLVATFSFGDWPSSTETLTATLRRGSTIIMSGFAETMEFDTRTWEEPLDGTTLTLDVTGVRNGASHTASDEVLVSYPTPSTEGFSMKLAPLKVGDTTPSVEVAVGDDVISPYQRIVQLQPKSSAGNWGWIDHGAGHSGAVPLDEFTFPPLSADWTLRLRGAISQWGGKTSAYIPSNERVVAPASTLEAPQRIGFLDDVTFDLGSGVQTVETAHVFEGEELTFSAVPSWVGIDAGTGVVSIPTDALRDAVVVTITASNGVAPDATAAFQVTVEEAAPAETFDDATLIGTEESSGWGTVNFSTDVQGKRLLMGSVTNHKDNDGPDDLNGAAWERIGFSDAGDQDWLEIFKINVPAEGEVLSNFTRFNDNATFVIDVPFDYEVMEQNPDKTVASGTLNSVPGGLLVLANSYVRADAVPPTWTVNGETVETLIWHNGGIINAIAYVVTTGETVDWECHTPNTDVGSRDFHAITLKPVSVTDGAGDGGGDVEEPTDPVDPGDGSSASATLVGSGTTPSSWEWGALDEPVAADSDLVFAMVGDDDNGPRNDNGLDWSLVEKMALDNGKYLKIWHSKTTQETSQIFIQANNCAFQVHKWGEPPAVMNSRRASGLEESLAVQSGGMLFAASACVPMNVDERQVAHIEIGGAPVDNTVGRLVGTTLSIGSASVATDETSALIQVGTAYDPRYGYVCLVPESAYVPPSTEPIYVEEPQGTAGIAGTENTGAVLTDTRSGMNFTTNQTTMKWTLDAQGDVLAIIPEDGPDIIEIESDFPSVEGGDPVGWMHGMMVNPFRGINTDNGANQGLDARAMKGGDHHPAYLAALNVDHGYTGYPLMVRKSTSEWSKNGGVDWVPFGYDIMQHGFDIAKAISTPLESNWGDRNPANEGRMFMDDMIPLRFAPPGTHVPADFFARGLRGDHSWQPDFATWKTWRDSLPVFDPPSGIEPMDVGTEHRTSQLVVNGEAKRGFRLNGADMPTYGEAHASWARRLFRTMRHSRATQQQKDDALLMFAKIAYQVVDNFLDGAPMEPRGGKHFTGFVVYAMAYALVTGDKRIIDSLSNPLQWDMGQCFYLDASYAGFPFVLTENDSAGVTRNGLVVQTEHFTPKPLPRYSLARDFDIASKMVRANPQIHRSYSVENYGLWKEFFEYILDWPGLTEIADLGPVLHVLDSHRYWFDEIRAGRIIPKEYSGTNTNLESHWYSMGLDMSLFDTQRAKVTDQIPIFEGQPDGDLEPRDFSTNGDGDIVFQIDPARTPNNRPITATHVIAYPMEPGETLADWPLYTAREQLRWDNAVVGDGLTVTIPSGSFEAGRKYAWSTIPENDYGEGPVGGRAEYASTS